jgi:hypothetical protein
MDKGLMCDVAEAIRRADGAVEETRRRCAVSKRLREQRARRIGVEGLSHGEAREHRQDRVLPAPSPKGSGNGNRLIARRP